MSNIKKLSKWNASRGKMASDLETIARNARLEYRNLGVPAFSEESHVIHQKLEYAFDLIAEQSKTIALQQMQINELTSMLLKRVRDDSIEEPEEETTTVSVTVTTTTKRKWTAESIERAFDHFRRDNAYFGIITPEIVKRNWSTLFTQCPRYTGMTLGQFLNQYNNKRPTM